MMLKIHRPIYQRAFARLQGKLCSIRWKLYFAHFGSHSFLKRPSLLYGGKNIKIGSNVTIWKGARIEAFADDANLINLTIGDGTVIQPNVHLAAAERLSIGKNCLFASNVYISDHDHDWQDVNVPIVQNPAIQTAAVEIGDNVWLGERVIVLKGVSIGEGAILGAGSVVTSDIPKRCVAVGVPAKVIKSWDPIKEAWVDAEK